MNENKNNQIAKKNNQLVDVVPFVFKAENIVAVFIVIKI